MGHLRIAFAGICTHFLRSDLGVQDLPVPHRVVLPYVGTFRFGLVDTTVPGFPTQPYFIQPHFPFLKYDDSSIPAPTIPGLTVNGHFYGTGCNISVLNPTSPLKYDASFKDVYHLGDFADYTPSDEVVTGGRAACYFDITSGTVSMTGSADSTILVVLDVDTELDPVLRISRFDDANPFDLHLPGNDVTMTLYNAEVGGLGNPADELAPYDFLLHYETSRRSVPLQLKQAAPGMTAASLTAAPWTKDSIKRALDDLASVASGVDITGGPDVAAMASMNFTSLSPSCSNSQYP